MQSQRFFSFMLVLLLPNVLCAELVGSPHDFSKASWSSGQICLPCHAVHNAVKSGDAAPLWNRIVNMTSYRVYASSTFDADIGQPGGVSKLCLSCHDGITAVDRFGGADGSVFISGDANLGNDPGDHHPISFVFNTALALEDGDLHDPATAVSGLGGTVAEDLLANGRVECTSCHDPHNRNEFLRYIDTGGGVDGLCLTCHISAPPKV
jgi:hypothetical protein